MRPVSAPSAGYVRQQQRRQVGMPRFSVHVPIRRNRRRRRHIAAISCSSAADVHDRRVDRQRPRPCMCCRTGTTTASICVSPSCHAIRRLSASTLAASVRPSRRLPTRHRRRPIPAAATRHIRTLVRPVYFPSSTPRRHPRLRYRTAPSAKRDDVLVLALDMQPQQRSNSNSSSNNNSSSSSSSSSSSRQAAVRPWCWSGRSTPVAGGRGTTMSMGKSRGSPSRRARTRCCAALS